MLEEQLKQLTRFNPMLIAGFEGESVEGFLGPDGQPTVFSTMIPGVAQQADMLAAYLHAQKVLMNWQQLDGIAAVTEEEWITTIKDLHGLMAKSLLANHKMEAGCYTQLPILPWHPGSVVHFRIFDYFFQCRYDRELQDKKAAQKLATTCYGSFN